MRNSFLLLLLFSLSSPAPPVTGLLIDGVDDGQFGLVVAHFGGRQNAQLVEGGTNLLLQVGPDFADVASALVLYGFEVAHGQSVVVDATAGLQRSHDDAGLGYHVRRLQVVHGLADVPPVYVRPVEEGFVASVHFGGALHLAMGMAYLAHGCNGDVVKVIRGWR